MPPLPAPPGSPKSWRGLPMTSDATIGSCPPWTTRTASRCGCVGAAPPTARGVPTVRADRAAREGRIKGWAHPRRSSRPGGGQHGPNTPKNRHAARAHKGHFARRYAGTTPTQHPTLPPQGDNVMLRLMDTANSPGATPGATPNPEEDGWLTAMEVAAFIGKSERTARTWVAERGIPARAGRPERWSEHAIRIHLQNPRGNIGATPGVTPETAPGQAGNPSKPIEAAYRVTPAEIEQAVSRTSAQYMGDLRTMLAEVGKVYEGQLAAKEQVITTQGETIAELRRRAEEAAQAARAVPGVQEAPGGGQEADPGVWARVRRDVRSKDDATARSRGPVRAVNRAWFARLRCAPPVPRGGAHGACAALCLVAGVWHRTHFAQQP